MSNTYRPLIYGGEMSRAFCTGMGHPNTIDVVVTDNEKVISCVLRPMSYGEPKPESEYALYAVNATGHYFIGTCREKDIVIYRGIGNNLMRLVKI